MKNPFAKPTLDAILADLTTIADKLDKHASAKGTEIANHQFEVVELQAKITEKSKERDRAARISDRLNDLLK